MRTRRVEYPALIDALLRCVALLLPPFWLGSGWWGGDASPWSNPRARFKRAEPLTHAEDAFEPRAPWRRFRSLWSAAERFLSAVLALSCRLCSPFRAASPSSSAPEEEDAIPAASMSAPLREISAPVTITVAIQAAEDEEPEAEEEEDEASAITGELQTGSGSEDEAGAHEKSSGAGTSGGELEEGCWKPPDQQLIHTLVAQIEFYLSDENLQHDAFLLKHVRRNKLGFVSVKLLTSFKKVKHLTRDWRTTAYALRHSSLLELNEEGRKVRRRSAVPVFPSESLPSRMLLLSQLHHWHELGLSGNESGNGENDSENIGTEPNVTENGSEIAKINSNIAENDSKGCRTGSESGPTHQERLMELLLKAFGNYGSIASVRVLKPGKDLPADLKKLSGRYSQLGTEECAIVEFEEVEAAMRAHQSFTADGVKVVLIGTKPPKKKVQKERARDEDNNGTGMMRKSRSLNSRVRELQYHNDDSAASSSETESNPTSPRIPRKSRSCNKLSPTSAGPNHLSPVVSPRSSPWSSPRASPSAQRKIVPSSRSPLANEGRLSPESGRRWADYSSDSSLTPVGSPWVQRRKQVASQESSPVGSPMLQRKNADGLPPGVMRLPRGPDGTRGFHGAIVGGKSAATQT
ncbi:hypothetical protein DNTS_029715 [Danionella cerebrum]|uniref:Uncharacterized protein n=1 Tax=Danionella cerebrum TaxID=2873325 RepID=A0A553RLL2_9TELE|nr:hypothetical protein DNTS_029715 [Danionella translucida]